ncbi:hypothetical protein FRB95_010246, partial [Tulasnella sp. JGI-2019a]
PVGVDSLSNLSISPNAQASVVALVTEPIQYELPSQGTTYFNRFPCPEKSYCRGGFVFKAVKYLVWMEKWMSKTVME